MLPRGMNDRPLVPLGPGEVAVGFASLIGLVLIVTLGSASTDGGPTGSALIAEYGPALLRAVVILLGIAEALVVLLVIWALWPDGEKRGQPRARRSWLAMTIASLVQLAAGLLLLWYLRHRRLGGQLMQPGSGVPGLSNLKPPGMGSPLPSGTEWLTAFVVLAVVALAAWRIWRTLGLRARSRRLGLAEQLGEAVALSIADLESDPDSRRAVIAAYGRMIEALSGRGLSRKPNQTALEYLAGILASLDVSEPQVRRLTELFQFAKFSPHEVDATMKAEAIAALREIRAGLPAPSGPLPAIAGLVGSVR